MQAFYSEIHTLSSNFRYCYCGESGDWYKKMLQCRKCHQWFHLECIRSTVVPRTILLGDKFYDMVCTLCTGTCEEDVTRLDLNWADALHLTLFNLTVVNNNKYHDLDTSILPFLKRRLKSLQGPGCLLKVNRLDPDFITSLLSSHRSRFRCGSESKKRSNYWGLCQVAPPSVSSSNSMNTISTIRTKDTQSNGRIVGGNSSLYSYSIKQQRRPAMKSSAELAQYKLQNSSSNDAHTPSVVKPLKPLVLKLNTPSNSEHMNGSKNSFKNSLLAIKDPYGLSSRKSSSISGLKGQKSDSNSFLDPLPLALSSDNQLGLRGVFGGYEFNNGWRNFKAIMRKHSFREILKKNGNVGALDSIIPPPKNFEGSNNPFRAFNQEPPILFPQTTLSTYDMFSNSSSRNYLNRRQRRFYQRNRFSFSSSRKSSINSSGEATPERDMDCSSSCSNSVDENVGCAFSNPPPLLDFSEPLHLAPPSPPPYSSKGVETSQNTKSHLGSELLPPPAAIQYSTSLSGESNRLTSHNNNKPTLGMNSKLVPNGNSNGISKSIKHKTATLGDLKCPSLTSSSPTDGAEYKDQNYSNDSKFSVNARRLTLDGDIQYLFDWNAKEKSIPQNMDKDHLVLKDFKEKVDDNLKVKNEIDTSNKFDEQDVQMVENPLVIKEEEQEEDIKKELIIDSQSSVKKIKEELPLNNTANSALASLVVLD